ncbi:heterokaryon incompatibility protein [Botrytis cinerea]
MLCTACQDISFVPLQQTGVTFQKDATEEIRAAYANHGFYFHESCRKLPEVYSECSYEGSLYQRFEDRDDGFDASMRLAITWMIDCFDHRLCRETIGALPTRVIYIDENPSIAPRLVESKGQVVSYATLSYCWGRKGQLQLKKANHLQFLNALPVQLLSMTTQDAIRVTRALSIKYLWVDALCIIQDSTEDKLKELAVMGEIYSRSVITIGAANGDYADAGLFAKRDPHRQRPCPIYEIETNGSKTQIFAELPRDDEQGTILDSRGWIFQEEALSARTLKFCSDGLRWSCVTVCATETTPNGNSHPSNKLDYRLKTWLHYPEWNPRWVVALDPKRRYFQDWYEAVSSFTARDLTYHTDKLPALAGVATRIHKIRRYDYLAGLWKQDLEYGLLLPPTNVSASRWPGTLGQEKADGSGEGEIIGFVALDSDPTASGLRANSLAILLMREDKDPLDLSMEKNGKLGYHSSEKVPQTLSRLPDGSITLNSGTKRYLTGLALQQVRDFNNLAIFRRVGLCQLYREFWTDELKIDSSKKMFNLMVV